MTSLSATAKWVPSIDDTTELIGIILLFIPYMIILLPFLQTRIIIFFQRLYLHRTPRDDWNSAVDQHPPRRLAGYIFSIIFTFTAILLILINNNYNNYWVDFMQYFIYLSLPLILSIIRPPSHRPCDIFDFLIILLVIMPIEISQEIDAFLPDIHFTIYPSWGNSPHISILNVCGFNLFLFIFFIFRPLNNIGLGWDITHNNFSRFKWILLRFITILFIFLIIAIPFCIIPGIQFLHPSQKLSNIWIDGIARYFALFFLNNLIFEMLYRGVVQNLFHSALDFRSEARSYLRGGKFNSSLIDIYDETTDEKSNDGIMVSPQMSDRLKNKSAANRAALNTVNSINAGPSMIINNKMDDAVDINTLPYFEGSSGDSDEIDKRNEHRERDTLLFNKGICYFLRFDNFRDWFVIVISSIIYAITIVDYKHYDETKDLIYGMILMFWLSICCGWLYRLTNSCFISAIFNSIILFNFKYIFNPNTQFCNGAC
eukprot:371270_1